MCSFGANILPKRSEAAHVQPRNKIKLVPSLRMCRFGTPPILTYFLKLACSGHVQAHSQLLDSKTFVQCARTSTVPGLPEDEI